MPIEKIEAFNSVKELDFHIAIGNNKTRKETALKLDARYLKFKGWKPVHCKRRNNYWA